jgi:hypothetical protein
VLHQCFQLLVVLTLVRGDRVSLEGRAEATGAVEGVVGLAGLLVGFVRDVPMELDRVDIPCSVDLGIVGRYHKQRLGLAAEVEQGSELLQSSLSTRYLALRPVALLVSASEGVEPRSPLQSERKAYLIPSIDLALLVDLCIQLMGNLPMLGILHRQFMFIPRHRL